MERNGSKEKNGRNAPTGSVSGGWGEAACSLLREPVATTIPKPAPKPAVAMPCLALHMNAGSQKTASAGGVLPILKYRTGPASGNHRQNVQNMATSSVPLPKWAPMCSQHCLSAQLLGFNIFASKPFKDHLSPNAPTQLPSSKLKTYLKALNSANTSQGSPIKAQVPSGIADRQMSPCCRRLGQHARRSWRCITEYMHKHFPPPHSVFVFSCLIHSNPFLSPFPKYCLTCL